MINHQAQKEVEVAYRRWLFARGYNCNALTEKILVFWIGDFCVLVFWIVMGGGCLQEVVTHGGSTVQLLRIKELWKLKVENVLWVKKF